MTKAYAVQKTTFDAARPYAVVATFRSFNKVIARYEDEAAAKRRARDLNRNTALGRDEQGYDKVFGATRRSLSKQEA